MALLMCHIHYTPTQPEIPGLIDITLPNKNLKTTVTGVFSLKYSMATGEAGVFYVDQD